MIKLAYFVLFGIHYFQKIVYIKCQLETAGGKTGTTLFRLAQIFYLGLVDTRSEIRNN